MLYNLAPMCMMTSATSDVQLACNAATGLSSQHPEPVSGNRHSFSRGIALRVRSVLAARGMKQKQLARLTGCTPQHINRVLKGNSNLTIKTIALIENALDIQLISIPGGLIKQSADSMTIDAYPLSDVSM